MVVWEALDALSHQLELCKIDPTTRVVLLLDDKTSESQAQLLRTAIARTRAEAIEIRSIHMQAGSDTLIPFVSLADVVVTTIQDDHLYDQALSEAQTVLRLHSDLAPQDFAPHISMRRRVHALNDMINDAQTLSLTDSQGTDLQVLLVGCELDYDHGILDDDNVVATFPSGWVSAVPNKLSVQGQVVLMPGDANLTAGRVLSSPVRMEIEKDLITRIDGDSPDADVIRALLESPDEPDAYGVAEVAVGMNPAPALDLFDPRRTVPHLARLLGGSVTISFGHNLVADRPCSQTVGFSLPRRTVRVDDLPVVTHGVLQGDFAPDVYEL